MTEHARELPLGFSAGELARANVRLTVGGLDQSGKAGWWTELQCNKCRATWNPLSYKEPVTLSPRLVPDLIEGTDLPQGYWRCSRGCNENADFWLVV